MRALLAAALLMLPLAAAADSSVGAPGLPAGTCDYEKGPFETGRRNPVFARVAERLGMSFMHATARHALLSRGNFTPGTGAAIVDARTGAVEAQLPVNATSLVEDAAGQVIALVAIDPARVELVLLDPRSGAVRWHRKQKPYLDDTVLAILDGDRLIVAGWHRFATGSRLFAVDFATGAPRWSADVEQLGVAHSEYYNDVLVGVAGGQVTLRGLEAGGCCVQKFNAATGRRLASTCTRRW